MKITMYRSNGKDVTIPMPLAAFSSKSFWKQLDLEADLNDPQNQKFTKEIADVLGRYRKKYGSFTLIDAKDENGEGLKIVI